MPPSKVFVALMAFGLIVLMGATLIPGVADVARTDAETTLDLRNGSVQDVGSFPLDVNLTSVNASNDSVVVELRNTKTYDTNSTRVDVGNTSTVDVAGGNVTVAPQSVVSGDRAYVKVEHASTYGLDDGPSTFLSNVPVLIIGVLVVMFIGLVFMGVRV